MSREGRAQPIQPFAAAHGFVGNTPANGTLPGRVTVCENDDRRRRTPPLQPVVLSGAYATVSAPTVTPPAPTNIDRADQRARYRPLDPVSLNGLLASLIGAPAVLPAGPFVVPLDERRRFLAQLAPTILHGADDPDPPLPNVVEPDRRRRPTPDPLSISGTLATFFGPFVAPPRPVVVLSDERGRRVYPQPVMLAGPAFPAAVVAAIYTQDFGPGDPRGNQLAGRLGGAAFQAGRPGRG